MIVGDLYVPSIASTPNKTHPPLIIDTDALLSCAIGAQGFQPVAGRRAKILEFAWPHRLPAARSGRSRTLRRSRAKTSYCCSRASLERPGRRPSVRRSCGFPAERCRQWRCRARWLAQGMDVQDDGLAYGEHPPDLAAGLGNFSLHKAMKPSMPTIASVGSLK